MTHSHIRKVIAIGCLLMLCADRGVAQQVAVQSALSLADSTPAQIMSVASRGFPQSAIVDVLREPYRHYSEAKRTELANRVVQFAITSPRDASDAVRSIGMSGFPASKMRGAPDLTALQRLIEIHREARNEDTRGSALRELIFQDQPGRAVAYLGEVAASRENPASLLAVARLSDLAFATVASTIHEQKQAEAALRDLYEKDLVKFWPAAGELCMLAYRRHWPTATRCHGLM